MSEFYSDPSVEWRECLTHYYTGTDGICTECNGTGHLGDPDAQPDIWIEGPYNGRYFAVTNGDTPAAQCIAEGDTEATALTAARKGILGITDQDIAETMPPKPEMER